MGKNAVLIITIPDKLPSLNEYVKACRANAHAGNKMSREAHYLCRLGMLRHHGKTLNRVHITFKWFEKNKRRDKDNVAFAKKFILDALQEEKIIKNDGWHEIEGFTDEFYISKENPHVEVILKEMKEGMRNEETVRKMRKNL